MRFVKYLLFFLPIVAFVSCSSQQSGVLVAEFGNNKIYLDEFEKAYAKNSGGLEKAKSDSIEAYEKFLDLYVNFKMKLRDAQVRGFKSDESLEKEYIDYKYNLGKTIFLEKELFEPAVKKLYDRRKFEYRASHIFFIEDSINTKEKIEEKIKTAYNLLNQGEDFAKVVKDFSMDNETKNNGGDVYYFTAGQIGSAIIEDAVYSLKVGEVFPMVVRSGMGYHIIKVTDIQPRKQSVKLAHIFAAFQDSVGVKDSLKALKKIQQAEAELKKGAKFEDLAATYSDDKYSNKKGGEFGDFDRGKIVRELDEAAFKLKPGEISNIVKTPYGYHIVKNLEEKPLPSYEASKEELKNLFQRYRYKNDYDVLIADLKKEYNFKRNEPAISKILGQSDTVKILPSYLASKLCQNFGKETVISINEKQFPLDSLINFLTTQQSFINKTILPAVMNEGIDLYAGELLIRAKAESYDKTDSSFAKLMEDYRNGMYLFKISEEEIWNKVTFDSTKLYNYWNANKENFTWTNRVEFKEIYCTSDTLINKIYSKILIGENFDTLYVKHNQRSGYENKPGYYGLVDVKINDLAIEANALKNVNDISKPFKFEEGWSIVKLVGKYKARLKTFEEAKAEAASLFQESESKRLETEYINRLKAIYNPKVYNEKLQKAFKN